MDKFRRVQTLPDLAESLLPKSASARLLSRSGSRSESLPSLSSFPRSPFVSKSINWTAKGYLWIQVILCGCLALMVCATLVLLQGPTPLHTPGTSTRSIQVVYTSEYNALSPEHQTLVPFMNATVLAPVVDALTFQAAPLYAAEQRAVATQLDRLPPGWRKASEQCPASPSVRLFIGIASRASPVGMPKRNAMRNSWLHDVTSKYSDRIKAQFLVSQPQKDVQSVATSLAEEIEMHGDMAVLPGLEDYYKLPEKTLATMRYALSSACDYTHILKTDDDVYVRPGNLLNIIDQGLYDFSMAIQAKSNLDYFAPKKKVRDNPERQIPWMSHMFIGKVDRNVSGTFPGFEPVRDPKNKWYLSEEAYPSSLGPYRVRWISGWGYMMSRDVVEFALERVLDNGPKPSWFGRLPWEDVAMASLLKDYTPLHHIETFKAAWDTCTNDTALKHLDNQVGIIAGLREQDLNGVWDAHTIPCSAGTYEEGKYKAWRAWRNQQADSLVNGFM